MTSLFPAKRKQIKTQESNFLPHHLPRSFWCLCPSSHLVTLLILRVLLSLVPVPCHTGLLVFPHLKTTAIFNFTSFSEHWTITLPLILILFPCPSYQNTRSGVWPSVKLQSQEPAPNSSSGSHEPLLLSDEELLYRVQNRKPRDVFLGFRYGVWTEAAQGSQETSAFVGSCYPPVTFGPVRHSASHRGSAVLKQLFRFQPSENVRLWEQIEPLTSKQICSHSLTNNSSFFFVPCSLTLSSFAEQCFTHTVWSLGTDNLCDHILIHQVHLHCQFNAKKGIFSVKIWHVSTFKVLGLPFMTVCLDFPLQLCSRKTTWAPNTTQMEGPQQLIPCCMPRTSSWCKLLGQLGDEVEVWSWTHQGLQQIKFFSHLCHDSWRYQCSLSGLC